MVACCTSTYYPLPPSPHCLLMPRRKKAHTTWSRDTCINVDCMQILLNGQLPIYLSHSRGCDAAGGVDYYYYGTMCFVLDRVMRLKWSFRGNVTRYKTRWPAAPAVITTAIILTEFIVINRGRPCCTDSACSHISSGPADEWTDGLTIAILWRWARNRIRLVGISWQLCTAG